MAAPFVTQPPPRGRAPWTVPQDQAKTLLDVVSDLTPYAVENQHEVADVVAAVVNAVPLGLQATAIGLVLGNLLCGLATLGDLTEVHRLLNAGGETGDITYGVSFAHHLYEALERAELIGDAS